MLLYNYNSLKSVEIRLVFSQQSQITSNKYITMYNVHTLRVPFKNAQAETCNEE